jgi:hypothetical protein
MIADNRWVTVPSYVRMIALAVATLLLSACSDYKDALVVNPCGDEILVRFGGNETADDPVWRQRTATPIGPMTTQFVKSAFVDVGLDEYSVLVSINGTRTVIRVADVGETILVPVPDSLC